MKDDKRVVGFSEMPGKKVDVSNDEGVAWVPDSPGQIKEDMMDEICAHF